MGRIKEIYIEMRNRARNGYPLRSNVSQDPRNDVNYGMKVCPDCHGKKSDEICINCLGFGIVPRTIEDEENDFINEMELRGDAKREER